MCTNQDADEDMGMCDDEVFTSSTDLHKKSLLGDSARDMPIVFMSFLC